MKISWTRVTWYSQIIAIILFVGIFAIGIWLGMHIGHEKVFAIPAAQGNAMQHSSYQNPPVAMYSCGNDNEVQATFTRNAVSLEMAAESTSTELHCTQIAAPVSP